MKALFLISEERHERGPVIAAWQQPEGNLLATAGRNGKYHVLNAYQRRDDG